LRLSDDDWRKIPVSTVQVPSNGGPVVTGDPIVDRWERELFEGLSDDEDGADG